MNTEFDAIVIGAGIAGLSAAHCLQTAGKRVCVLDKSRDVGGRMATRITSELQCDHGAQYFTAQSPAFRAQVAAWLKAKAVARWKAPMAAWNGSELSLSKPKARYVGTPFMKSPLQLLAKNLTVKLSTHVTSVAQTEVGWRVNSDLQSWTAKQLVIALPAAQAQALLPQKQLAYDIAANALMEPCWALLLATEVHLPLPYAGVFVNQGAFSWIAQDNTKPQRNLPRTSAQTSLQTWVMHATPAWSIAHVECSAKEVEILLVAEFNRLLKYWLPALPIPIWKHSAIHRWRYARGTSTAVLPTHAWQQNGLALAGDWLAGGRVEGAYLSGLTAAQLLINS